MTINSESYFKKLWNLHFKWSSGILYNHPKSTPTAKIYLSKVPGEYFNFAVPKVKDPKNLNLAEITTVFEHYKKQPAFVLFSTHQKLGFTEYLVKQGYKNHGGDCWLVLDPESYTIPQVKVDIKEITPETYKDFYGVLSKVFTDFPGNETYLELCEKSINGKLHGKFKDLVSKLFVIYDNGIPVSGAGIFYSKEANVAYLHDGGTLPEYRGKGYQSALLKYRANVALKEGITQIYTSVEPGGQSWSNCIKVGFVQTPWSILLVKE